MEQAPSIRVLENDSNRRGDLFGRLMGDLFIALGYEQPRLNIQKSGRELDLDADHRLERRRAIAECKATSEPAGGDDVNKFIGALDAELNAKPWTAGYFISLSGFRETAIEQEKQGRRTGIVMLEGHQVIDELIAGRALISRERAADLAGRCVGQEEITLDPNPELLAHERGLIWAVFYTQGKARTHFVLIHADGTPLARALVDEVVGADMACGGQMDKLVCLNPPPRVGLDAGPRVADALAAYKNYLVAECGFVQLDGLPADNDVGSRRLALESLFVPLHLDVKSQRDGRRFKERRPVGMVLADHPRLALLSPPGAGKSMLIKRLAVAYIDPERRTRIGDDLPQRDWLPLFFRCRELRHLARASFAELMQALSQREPVRQYGEVFRAYVDRAILAGRVLLLVDGLDEISDPGDRGAFVCTLRTLLQAYPRTAVVVTSREAGFRHVAAHLASVCTHATLSPFDADDIRRLSVAWHREVINDTDKVQADAEQLAAVIVRNDRIQRLAVNPLLLTTLLLVKRWVGSLPTRRAVLYGKAVEVLLMTWNTEGHKPIPEEEAIPQLCYVASAMMLNRVQKISRPHLVNLLHEARQTLPTELGYVQGSVEEFILRVEDRSSLLMMSGHDVEDGRLVEFFEFRHLTFQEFLSARAMVEGWHPQRKEGDTLVDVLEPHFEDEEWREVIPLAAVLGGKATEPLLRRITEKLRELDGTRAWRLRENPLLRALWQCLADEAAARPEAIRASVRELVRLGRSVVGSPVARALARGRYGTDLRDEAVTAFVVPAPDLYNSARLLGDVVWLHTLETRDAQGYRESGEKFLELLRAEQITARCEGALGCARLCGVSFPFAGQSEMAPTPELLCKIGDALVPLLFREHTAEQYAACASLTALGAYQVWAPPAQPDVLGRLWFLWLHGRDGALRTVAARAMARQRIMPRDEKRLSFSASSEVTKTLEDYERVHATIKVALLVLSWYLHEPLDDAEIRMRTLALLERMRQNDRSRFTLMSLLDHLKEEKGTL